MKDRENRANGVLLAVKSATFNSVHKVVEEQEELELISAELTTFSKATICVCSTKYSRPPYSDKAWLKQCYDNVVIYGDFNLPMFRWNFPV